MIGAPAAQHSVFFERPHAGNRLARIENAGLRAPNGVDIFAGERGDATQVLHQVQNDAFATE